MKKGDRPKGDPNLENTIVDTTSEVPDHARVDRGSALVLNMLRVLTNRS